MEKILQYNNNKYNQFLVYIKTGEEGGKNREYLKQHLQTFIVRLMKGRPNTQVTLISSEPATS